MINSAQLSNKIFRLSSFSFRTQIKPVQLSLYNTRIETVNETEVIIKGQWRCDSSRRVIEARAPEPKGGVQQGFGMTPLELSFLQAVNLLIYLVGYSVVRR